ncbi:MAG: hypothetical protein AB1656_02625, partial [Candidatus Omnitrophota bacterium]
MKKNYRFQFVCLGAFLLSCGQIIASAEDKTNTSFEERHRQVLADNPAGVEFTIQFKDGKQAFNQGEIIPIEWSFSCRLPETYSFQALAYPKRELLDDKFYVDVEEGVIDPLDIYRRSVISNWGVRGGSAYFKLLENFTPVVVDLNDWLRFDKPGHYKVFVVTKSIMCKQLQKVISNLQPNPFIVSNIIEMDILSPDEKWREGALREAAAVLDSTSEIRTNGDYEKRMAAARVLRFLGTKESAMEIIRRFGTVDGLLEREFFYGMISFPNPQFAEAKMREALKAPQQAITYPFIQSLAFLKMLLTSYQPIPPYEAGNEEKGKIRQELSKKQQDEYDRIEKECWLQLISALPKKEEKARAISLSTVSEHAASRKRYANDPEFSDLWRTFSQDIATVFFSLPTNMQLDLLGQRWRLIAGPAMLPVLRKLCTQPPQAYSLNQSVCDMALKRLYQNSPDEGRELILQEIQNPQPRFHMSALGLLPDETLPGVEEAIAKNLYDNWRRGGVGTEAQILCQLVERFATREVLPTIREIYQSKREQMNCGYKAILIAYFLRWDEDFAECAIRKECDEKSIYTCRQSLLSQIAEYRMHPILEKIALEYLYNPDFWLVSDMIAFLGR